MNSNAFDTKIIIKFGDLFKQDGWKPIPVNEFFDSVVDERHVSFKSLHGAILKKYWSNNINDWDQQIIRSLSDCDFIESVTRDSGKSKKYKIGATAITKKIMSVSYVLYYQKQTSQLYRHRLAPVNYISLLLDYLENQGRYVPDHR
nr:macro domain-containing protein [Methanosarcina sp. UBA411]